MEEPICVICDELCQKDTVLLKELGLNTLVASSRLRFDNKHKKFEKMSSAYVHKGCQKRYNRQSCIDVARQSLHKKSNEGKDIIKEAKDFNFSVCCFFCGNDCSHDNKNLLRTVSNTSTK